jgi:hypothetical protein
LQFLIHHDEDAEVYVNGKLAGSCSGYIGAYELMPMDKGLKEVLRPGKNLLAVHCHQTKGGQYIDVGIVDVTEPEEK